MKRAEFNRLITGLGTYAEITHAKTGTVDPVTYCLSQSTSKATDALINQYGVNGREFVFRSGDVTSPPLRLDAIAISGDKYVFDVVIPLYEAGTGALIGYRAYAKGK